MPENWNWKSKDGGKARLLYEPGNWGDILKGEWVLQFARWAVKNIEGDFSSLDPFSGAPLYPASAAAKGRLRHGGCDLLAEYAAPFLDDGKWPNASLLMASLAGEGAFDVFDVDEERRGLLLSEPSFSVADGDCGWGILKEKGFAARTLVLVDPYDFLAEWREQLDNVLAAAENSCVMIYIYNRSAGNEERFRDYRKFRNALDDAWGDKKKILARVAADGFLPRAHHEMLFLPCGPVLQNSQFHALRDALVDSARGVASAVTDSGIIDLSGC